MLHRDVARIFQGGVTLFHTQVTYQIVSRPPCCVVQKVTLWTNGVSSTLWENIYAKLILQIRTFSPPELDGLYVVDLRKTEKLSRPKGMSWAPQDLPLATPLLHNVYQRLVCYFSHEISMVEEQGSLREKKFHIP